MKSHLFLDQPVSSNARAMWAGRDVPRRRTGREAHRRALKWWCVARADEWFAQGELGAARDFLRHAAMLDREDPRVWLTLGSVHYLLGELAEAGMAYVRAVRLRPHEARGWLHLALVHERMGQPGMALMLARRARELDPNDPAIRVACERLERDEDTDSRVV